MSFGSESTADEVLEDLDPSGQWVLITQGRRRTVCPA
jgi:hypothetical protein